jgi:hypothetical protein
MYQRQDSPTGLKLMDAFELESHLLLTSPSLISKERKGKGKLS